MTSVMEALGPAAGLTPAVGCDSASGPRPASSGSSLEGAARGAAQAADLLPATGPGTLESKEVRLPTCGAYPLAVLIATYS